MKIPNTKKAKLVAVSKKKSVEDIKRAIESGVTIIGENRVDEALLKYDKLKDFFKEHSVEFHFIGHLQRNKVKKIINIFDLIQCVDSLKLAEEISKRSGKNQDILLQVNIGKEEQKFGFDPDRIIEEFLVISKLQNIKVQGLMCIPPYNNDPEKARPYFRKMYELYSHIHYIKPESMNYLSMGMSNDYKVAMEEGANMVRIGRAIFGERE